MGVASFVPNYTITAKLPSTGSPNHTQIADDSDSTYVHLGYTDPAATDEYRIDVFVPALTITQVALKVRTRTNRSLGGTIGTVTLRSRVTNASGSRITLGSYTLSTGNGNINDLTFTLATCPLTGAAWRPEDLLNIESIKLTIDQPGAPYHHYVYKIWIEVTYDDSSLKQYAVLVPIADYQGGSGTDYQKVDDALYGRDGLRIEGGRKDWVFTVTPFTTPAVIHRVSAVWNIHYAGDIGAPSSSSLKLWVDSNSYTGATYFSTGYYNQMLSFRLFDTNPYTGSQWTVSDLPSVRVGAYLYSDAYGGHNSWVMYLIVYYTRVYPRSQAIIL